MLNRQSLTMMDIYFHFPYKEVKQPGFVLLRSKLEEVFPICFRENSIVQRVCGQRSQCDDLECFGHRNKRIRLH